VTIKIKQENNLLREDHATEVKTSRFSKEEIA